jgi:hypothetical protein
MYKYSVPDDEIKIQGETSLWVAHLTQPVYTQSLFYRTAIVCHLVTSYKYTTASVGGSLSGLNEPT